jgi:signal transduction histidine kinase
MSSESDGSELIAMKSIFMRAHCDKGGRPKGMASDEKCARSDKSVVFQQARTHERSCGAIVFEEMEGALHVLMIQHRAGHWSFPKGHMEKGESEHETAIREVREETGVEIEIASNFRGESTYSPRNGVSKTVAFFIGNRFGGTVRPQEGEVCAVHWMRAVDAVRLLTFDKDRAIFLNAFEHYLKHDRIYADDCHDLEKCGYERSSSDAFSLKERYTVDELLAIMAFLRSDEGCPWDRIQTHESIKGNFIEEASRRKFLSEISHELRTPVTVIRGSLEALRDGIVKEDDVREYYATMSDSAASLDRLISDLLELTRLDNPEFTLDMEAVNLQDVVEDAVRQTRQIASQKGVKIEFNVSDEHDEFYGDYGRLRQMLVNILNNAVKFTPSGSRVFVDYRLKGAAYASQRADAVISIRDEGIGMSEETIHHLFDRFYTTGKAGTDSTGLGLSIAKGIADRHTVEIDVVSREGEGSTFTLTFPPDDRHRVT